MPWFYLTALRFCEATFHRASELSAARQVQIPPLVEVLHSTIMAFSPHISPDRMCSGMTTWRTVEQHLDTKRHVFSLSYSKTQIPIIKPIKSQPQTPPRPQTTPKSSPQCSSDSAPDHQETPAQQR